MFKQVTALPRTRQGSMQVNREPKELATTTDEPQAKQRYTGFCKWYCVYRNWGFIERKGEPDIFVHGLSLEKTGIDKLTQGQRVSFCIKKDGKNKIRAYRVELI